MGGYLQTPDPTAPADPRTAGRPITLACIDMISSILQMEVVLRIVPLLRQQIGHLLDLEVAS